jgi:hypothetical protein
MDNSNVRKPIVGKYILDTLSIGMYNNPLMLMREYVQNSVDAIDEFKKKEDIFENQAIDIRIDGRNRSIRILDNGTGLSADYAQNALHDIGRSLKKIPLDRGFRGIGRLGGLGYCEALTFTTKAKGEKTYSVSRWDCKKLRSLIKDDQEVVNIVDLIDQVAEFNVLAYSKKREDHFFMVEMSEVKSPRDILLNVPIVKAYLSQVTPVPFDSKRFAYADIIDAELRKRTPKYDTYNICLNGEQVIKQYSDAVPLGKKSKDTISDIEFIELQNGAELLGFGWIAKLNLLGSINSTSLVDGIRVRCGNILVGDKKIFAELFREKRFSSYLVGEIHTIDSRLIPNSRRDDFEDNATKDDFLDCFVKTIGLPYSKQIREVSAARSNVNKIAAQHAVLEKTKRIIKEGYVSVKQKDGVIADLKTLLKSLNGDSESVADLIKELRHSSHLLDLTSNKLSPSKKLLLKDIFDIIYEGSSIKKDAEKIIKKISNTVTSS